MKVFDTVNKQELEEDRKGLIELMKNGRQVDFKLAAPVTDADGYLTWDTEHWSHLQGNKFIRTYELGGRTLRDFTHFNIYDMAEEFDPERAAEITVS